MIAVPIFKKGRKMDHSIDIVIPAYKPGSVFEKLIYRLQKQTVKPERIIVVNTGEEYWKQAEFDKTPFVSGTLDGIQLELYHITESEFDHGGTRRWAASRSQAEYMIFMTQDAVPSNQYLIENLLKAMKQDPLIGAAYARQLPAADCGMIERYTRAFNYGEKSEIKSKADTAELGIKTYFCSNVCAMYRRDIYLAAGGFVEHTIFNEDMICAGNMIQKGYKIAYAADARVIHSHNYSGKEQFRRNFDLAVSQVQHPEIFQAVSSESEGMKLVKKTARYLMEKRYYWLLPKLIWQSGCKYLGYRFGKSYKMLPQRVILRCTSNKNYWMEKKSEVVTN